ncbi:S9 family peptidase [Ponticaulis profundi]|uniref:DPP IV N-terminal domain-containing protein n=1 Tax=Ponticaulis profundi TaxID=2665222 RepID=A0ABW1SAT1_9PROT
MKFSGLVASLFLFSSTGLAMADTASAQSASGSESGQLLTIERLYASPSLNGPTAKGVKFSPDGQRVTFLKARAEDSARYDLWQFDVATGEQSLLVDSTLLEPEEVELSEAEKALRERKRIAGQKGIVSYDWGTANTILVPIGGDLHLVTLHASSWIGLKPGAETHGLTMASLAEQLGDVFFGEYGAEGHSLDRQSGELRQLKVLDSAEETVTSPEFRNRLVSTPEGEAVALGDVVALSIKTDVSEVRQLTQTEAFEYDARVSPRGNYVSFIRDGALFVIELATGKETQITPDAEPENAISYGVAEFVAQEEMSRYTGYWWSPDESYVAYTKVDESTVDVIERFDIAADKTTVIDQRYPRAGRPNAIVDLFVRNIETGETVQIDWRREDWGPATDQYLARVNWTFVHSGARILSVQRVDRDQTKIDVFNAYIEPRNPELEVMDTSSFDLDVQDKWVNLSSDYINNGIGFIRTNETTGFRHILLTPPEAGEATQLTQGEWVVSKIEGSNEENGLVFFTGFKDTPLEKHLYSVPVDGGKAVRITEAGKSWAITMSPDGKSFVGTSSSPTQPPQTGLYTAEGELIAWIEENRLDENHPYFPYLENHTTPTFGTLTAEDGQTLHYSYQTPPDFDPNKQYPVIVEVYGGPHVQTVDRDWEKLSDVFYTHQGYIVFRLDNRGSWNRGKAFEDVIYRQTGGPEVRDQLKGVEWLKEQSFVDADRIAIQGWSYGGYMTLMTLLQAEPDTFAAAASGAPVTDWSLYDTFYTERYMDTPQDNADGYEKSSVFYHLDKWEGDLPPLLLMHGMADDNVTFDNMTRLMAELQQRGLLFDVMTYPGQRHGIRGEALQIHLMKTRMRFLSRYFKSE